MGWVSIIRDVVALLGVAVAWLTWGLPWLEENPAVGFPLVFGGVCFLLLAIRAEFMEAG